jgi:Putative zinc-finger/Sigma-70, region 4
MLRNTAIDRWRLDRFVVPCEQMPEREPHYDEDRLIAAEQATLVTRAFATLPKRWQQVLWFTEVDQASPARIAPLLGISPNAVAALAYRAREGLRQAYLRMHSYADGEDACRVTRPRLGAWLRGGLSPQVARQVCRHLDDCGRCRAVMAELADLNAEMGGAADRPSRRTRQGPHVRPGGRGTGRLASVPRATLPKAAGAHPGTPREPGKIHGAHGFRAAGQPAPYRYA